MSNKKLSVVGLVLGWSAMEIVRLFHLFGFAPNTINNAITLILLLLLTILFVAQEPNG